MIASQTRQPNILFLLADDQSYWSTGYNGHSQAKTPNLDALASEGIIFDRHYITSPICMASRACIATGLYEYRTGCNFEHGRMTQEMFSQSYHMLMKNAGYFVGYAGKFGFGIEDGGNWPRPDYYHEHANLPGGDFDWWRGLPGQGSYVTSENDNMAYLADEYPHLTRALAASTNEFFDEAVESNRPFCLSIGFKSPHGPLTPDPMFDDVYRDTEFLKPGNYGAKGATHLSDQVKTGRQWVNFENFSGEFYDPTYRGYFQLIHGMDYAIGEIRTNLAKRGLSENTIIIFSSDNGFFCGSHRMGGKVLTYEEPSRVPLLVLDPRNRTLTPGTRINHLSANIDIAPTILDFSNVDAPNEIDGVSLVPLLSNPSNAVRDELRITNFWNMPPTQGLSVTNGKYKYIYYWYEGEGMNPSEEMYDLETDPLEMNNLIGSAEHGLESMRTLYDAAVMHIKEEGNRKNRYEHYGVLLDRSIPWHDKKQVYDIFFDAWISTAGSWRGGTWFEDLDLSAYPEEVTYNYGIKPKQ